MGFGAKKKGKMPYKILKNPRTGLVKTIVRRFSGALSEVHANDKLYIILHGAEQGSSFIGASRGAICIQQNGTQEWSGGTLKKYSPEEFARHLFKERLTLSFKDLRLFACGSGLIPSKKDVGACFAARLATSMKQLGYSNIQVTGYLGSVTTYYGTRQLRNGDYTVFCHKGVTTTDGFVMPASMAKITF
ncbi:TPA: hypothetical protein J1184_004831 [Escherichia coli]|nr:hypothetical protein [Escherichia coli]HBA8202235.1 hypothetical protein [Escherichia coli]HBA8669934.1 hypothetical protein [Escherichia coli]HBA8710209.1 hypothetical protein [Escherichia coli]